MPEEPWNSIAPLLTADGTTSARRHDALCCDFFENKTFAEVGRRGRDEDAAKMQRDRAWKALRSIFHERGVPLTTTIMPGGLGNSVQAAPALVAKIFDSVAITKGRAAAYFNLIPSSKKH